MGRHAHAVRGRPPRRRRRQDCPIHAPLGRHDRRKGTVERNGECDDWGVVKWLVLPTLQDYESKKNSRYIVKNRGFRPLNDEGPGRFIQKEPICLCSLMQRV